MIYFTWVKVFEITDGRLMLPEIATLEYMDNWDGTAVDTGMLLRTWFSLTFLCVRCFAHVAKHLFHLWETICDHCCGGFKVRSMVTEQNTNLLGLGDARICWDKLFWSGVLDTQKLTICRVERMFDSRQRLEMCSARSMYQEGVCASPNAPSHPTLHTDASVSCYPL